MTAGDINPMNSTITRDNKATKSDIILLKDDEDFLEGSTPDLRGSVQLVVAQNQTAGSEGEDYNTASGSGGDEGATLLHLQEPRNITLDSYEGNKLLQESQVKKHQNQSLDSAEEDKEDSEEDEDEAEDKARAAQIQNVLNSLTPKVDAHTQRNVSMLQNHVEITSKKLTDNAKNGIVPVQNASTSPNQAAIAQAQLLNTPPAGVNIVKPSMVFNKQNITYGFSNPAGARYQNLSTNSYKQMGYTNFVPQQSNLLINNNRLQNTTNPIVQSFSNTPQYFNKSNTATLSNALNKQPDVTSNFAKKPAQNTYVLISADKNNKTTKVKLNSRNNNANTCLLYTSPSPRDS